MVYYVSSISVTLNLNQDRIPKIEQEGTIDKMRYMLKKID